jgi:hypothetical protein
MFSPSSGASSAPHLGGYVVAGCIARDAAGGSWGGLALPRDPGQMNRKGGTRSETSRTALPSSTITIPGDAQEESINSKIIA